MWIKSPLHNRQSGATMIEVMVALFLLAVGLLGTLALQNSSQRSNQSAMFSSVAIVLARDMANRINANNNAFSADDDNLYDSVDTDDISGAATVCTVGCDQAAIKTMDTGQWAEEVKSKLPAGRGTVDINDDGVHEVIVMWDDQLTGASQIGCGGNPDTDLTCVKLEFRL
ncbi:type IV pilus modification protein PilV [uncultured Pseudoteredinibacter sp.]|uniref:type IV pilus modification protein PilV n=1 Tax=uncultured Pseudoteredinibacter sp. TaxID=1641701 RepID=UPI00260A410C|nr:type IV pilus modification protein PilV [uncultured Pseudoteredinibacter sp.]